MRKIYTLLAVLALVLAAGSAQADFIFGEPVKFRCDITGVDDMCCLSYDGLEMYIDSPRSGGWGNNDLWVLKRASKDDEWGPAENLGPAVNSPQWDVYASISGDGLTLYFSSSRGRSNRLDTDIYMTTRVTKKDPWGPPVSLGAAVNSSAQDLDPWISPDDLELYFMSYRSGGYGQGDIWVARRPTKNDRWGDAVNLGPVVNSVYSEVCVSLSPDGLLLLFHDGFLEQPRRPGEYGGADMWMARRASLSDPWQTPVNLGPSLNSSRDDIISHISPDGRMLYFCSERDGGWDNWQAAITTIVDFNGDGQVDGKDMTYMAGKWGTNEPLYDIGPFAWGDGTVDLQDLTVLTECLGREVIDPTLIAHFKLDETGGSTAHDSISGNDDIVMGSPLWQPAGGQVGGALELDGADDCIISTSGPNPARGPLSVIVWIKGGAPGQVIISQPTAANWLAVDAGGKLMTELTGPGQSDGPLLSQTAITDGQWHRIALLWDGLQRTLCVDGVVVAQDAQSGLEACAGGLYIGVGKDYAANSFFSGLIDDVRIYNRAVKP